MPQPLYRAISSAVVDGRLPEGFSLPPTPGAAGPRWADGAMDGVSMYHAAPAQLTDEQAGLIAEAVTDASAGHYEAADALLADLTAHCRALSAVDVLQRDVMSRTESLSADHIYTYALRLAKGAPDTERVKIGLSLLELFDGTDGGETGQVVRTLGLSDEFTLFSAFVMRHWPGGNEELFRLAQKVGGWGRIHLVELIEPDTPRIRQWLLREGVHNDVAEAYSALACWEKSGAEDVLKGPVSDEDFRGVGDIIAALTDEGPVQGLSAMENGRDAVMAYLREAGKRALTDDDREVVRAVRGYYEGEEQGADVTAACDALLRA